MSERLQRVARALRAHGLAVGVGALLLVVGLFAIRWISAQQDAPPPRKAIQFTMVKVAPPPPPKAPEPPPPTPAKELDEPQPTRTEVRPIDLPPPDAPPPSPSAGPLALAEAGTGPGDAFNLAGNPGGKGLLSGGGLGDGSGDGVGGGSGSRAAWYYGKVKTAIEAVFRRQRIVVPASVKVEVRVWASPEGVVERIQLLRPTGDPAVDGAIQSVVGTSITERPPDDTPWPVILRLSFLRPG